MQRDAVELIEQALRLSVGRGMADDSIKHTFDKILRRVRSEGMDMSPENVARMQADGLDLRDEQ